MSEVRFLPSKKRVHLLSKTATKNKTLSLSSTVVIYQHAKIGKRPSVNPLSSNATLTSTPPSLPSSEKQEISSNGRFSSGHPSQPGTKENWSSSVMPRTPCYLVCSPLRIQSKPYSQFHRPRARRLPSNRRLRCAGNSPNECQTH